MLGPDDPAGSDAFYLKFLMLVAFARQIRGRDDLCLGQPGIRIQPQ